MSATGTTDEPRAAARAVVTGERLGERLRQLRIAAGMTQTELAAGRFSKEYMSQIERGKTRPTGETVRWLAERLGVDPSFLSGGIATADRSRLETALARAEALSEAHGYDEAIAEFGPLRPEPPGGVPDLEL